MSFQNFYTLIFKKKIRPKYFIFSFLIVLFIILISSFLLNILDITINDNDVIRKYQLAKISNPKFQDISTIVIGDSSGGNAINSQYFSQLTKTNTANLCLTGSWGIVGSVGILKKALDVNKNIKNVIIIQTLDIWSRPYSNESILELFPMSEMKEYISINALLAYYFNPKELIWHSKYFYKWITNSNNGRKIDLQNDYILQGKKTYANGLSKIDLSSTLNRQKISDAKNEELTVLQDFCHDQAINCIFANGPIHQVIAENSVQFFDYFDSNIKSRFTIKHINKVFTYNNEKMGDSSDHIDIQYKKDVTYDYYLELKKYLK